MGHLLMADDGTIYVELAWPDSTLSPNSRKHWRVLAKAKQAHREAAYSDTLGFGPHDPIEPTDLQIHLVFCPPDRRRYDTDNLLARLKASLDGMCDALGFDDRRFRRTIIDWGEPVKGGLVQVTISNLLV